MDIRYTIGLCLALGALLAGVFYLSRPVHRTALTILASKEPELGLPVYAQFTVTQSLRINETVKAAEIVIPMHVQEKYPVVRLFRNGKLAKEWNQEASEYAIDPPVLLDGTIEIQVDGNAIGNDAKNTAPRVYIEQADYYPDGNYRIADNEKAGDMALSIIEEVSNWNIWLEGQTNKPYNLVAQCVFGLLGITLLACLPRTFMKARDE